MKDDLMAGHAFSSAAALTVLAFLVMIVAGCASSEQPAAQHDAYYKGNGVAEYHGAHIGADDLRDQLPAE